MNPLAMLHSEHDWLFTLTGAALILMALLVALPVVAAIVATIRTRRGRKRRDAWRTSTLDVAIGYGVIAPLWLTMLPGGEHGVSLTPFHDMATTPPSEIVGNLLLLSVPAFCLPLRFGWLASVRRIGMLTATWSGLIEVAQYLLPGGRVASVDDVILNTTGGVIAALLSSPWWVRAPGSGRSGPSGSRPLPAPAPPGCS
jgi:glycopeptide antibiotics resistance protein